MKAKLIINDQALEIEISEEELQKLQTAPKKKTGYERVPEDNEFYYVNFKGDVECAQDFYGDYDAGSYNAANYYSYLCVAENNARADRLMWRLRRFAVEHRENEICWSGVETKKFRILYDSECNKICVEANIYERSYGVIYFDSYETAQAAIDEFHDELIWYFTEYKDSL